MIAKILLIGFFFGVLGTTIGGIIGCLFQNIKARSLSFILEFSAGLMMAVVSFDLLPESFYYGGILVPILFFGIGVMGIIAIEGIIKKVALKEEKGKEKNTLLLTGILVGIGIALHNLPEGIAIGSGFSASLSLGLSIAFVIAFHDIPEGIAMAVPMKTGGMKNSKVIFLTFLSGVPTAIGAFLGLLIGNISEITISACLAFAAGTMAYIVSNDLLAESKKIYRGRFASIGNMIGFLVGILVTRIG